MGLVGPKVRVSLEAQTVKRQPFVLTRFSRRSGCQIMYTSAAEGGVAQSALTATKLEYAERIGR
jgi:hypothetical protein